MNNEILDRLRVACSTIRSKSMPLADLIPLLQQAADVIEKLSLNEETIKNAERYKWLRHRTGGTSNKFVLPTVVVLAHQNIMKGSVSEHLDNTIDVAIANDLKTI